MKHIVWKAYYDFEKEERWINEMSARGLALTDYSWCRYAFADAEPNEYVYRIELLEDWPKHPESMAYIRFLEENGVECVATYFRWIYLRKKASEGPFDIYSDIDSKIKHYKRVNAFWTTMMFLELSIAIMNLGIGISNLVLGNLFGRTNIVCACILLPLALVFFRLGRRMRCKIRALRREKAVRE